MHYFSTRDATRTPVGFTDILLGGLAPDRGQYLPAEYPRLDDATLTEWRTLLAEQGYAALAAEVVKLFVDDIPAEDIEAMTARAYTAEKFGHDQILRITRLEGRMYLGHLSDGPTAAFKDIAMQLLGELFEYELNRRGETLNILASTTGDTGAAAEYAMRGRPGLRVFMLTPAGWMTPFQQAQMFGLDDPNIFNIAVDGSFDDCQDIVKAISTDAEFKRAHHIGAINSFNWARLMAPIVCYIAFWLKLTDRNDQKISFSVPTGNFGDLCAGHIVRQMGLPIDRLIVATNENDVLDEFSRTGIYRVRSAATTHKTSSPSMDISRASNFERFIFDLLGRDARRTAEIFGTRVRQGGFSLADDPAFGDIAGKFGLLSARSSHSDRVETIRDCHERLGVLIDPHTADGVKAARTWVPEVDGPVVCLETALPVKFAATVEAAIGREPKIPARFADVFRGTQHVTQLPNDVAAVKRFMRRTINHHTTIQS